MTNKEQSAAVVLQSLAEVKELAKKREELRLREWTQSEVDALLAHYRDSPNYGPEELQMLVDEVATAQAEGRLRDDTTATVDNLLARHGAGSWAFTVADFVLLECYSRELEHNPRARSSWEVQRPNVARLAPYLPHWVSPLEGGQRVMAAMVAQGRRADDEGDVGLTIAAATPKWAAFIEGSPHIAPLSPLAMNREAPPEVADLAEAMAQRFTTLEAVYAFCVEAYRTTPEDHLTLPMEELLGPQLPGMRWKVYPDVDSFRANLAVYRSDTNKAWARVSEALTNLDRTNRRAVEAALLKAVVPTR